MNSRWRADIASKAESNIQPIYWSNNIANVKRQSPQTSSSSLLVLHHNAAYYRISVGAAVYRYEYIFGPTLNACKRVWKYARMLMLINCSDASYGSISLLYIEKQSNKRNWCCCCCCCCRVNNVMRKRLKLINRRVRRNEGSTLNPATAAAK